MTTCSGFQHHGTKTPKKILILCRSYLARPLSADSEFLDGEEAEDEEAASAAAAERLPEPDLR